MPVTPEDLEVCRKKMMAILKSTKSTPNEKVRASRELRGLDSAGSRGAAVTTDADGNPEVETVGIKRLKIVRRAE